MKFKLVYMSVNGSDLSGTVSFLEKRYTRWRISSSRSFIPYHGENTVVQKSIIS